MAAAPSAAVPVSVLAWRIIVASTLRVATVDSASTDCHAQGLSLARDGRHRDAIAAFERCLTSPTLRRHEDAAQIAQSYEKLGNARQAERWREIAALLVVRPADLRITRTRSTARAVE